MSVTPTPLRTSPSLDIQTLYERKKTPKPPNRPSLKQPSKNPTKCRSKPSLSPKRKLQESNSSMSSITIQPLDNSKAVTLPADVVPSCTNLRLLCKSENEGSEGGSSYGESSREGSSRYGRGMSGSTNTDMGLLASSLNTLQVSNCTSNQNTEMSFYTSIYNDSRPQSAPAAGSRGTNTGND